MAPTQVMSSGKAVGCAGRELRDPHDRCRATSTTSGGRTTGSSSADVGREGARARRRSSRARPSSSSRARRLTPRDDAEMSTIALNTEGGQAVVRRPGHGPHRRGRPRGRAEHHPRGADRRRPSTRRRAGHGQPHGDDAADAAAGTAAAWSSRVPRRRADGCQHGCDARRGHGDRHRVDERTGRAPETPPEQMPGNTPEGAAMGAAGPEGTVPEEEVPAERRPARCSTSTRL